MFDELVEKERYGERLPTTTLHAVNNILRELYHGLGVDLGGLVVRPDAFRSAAKRWTARERSKAVQAVARAKDALARLVLPEMQRYLPEDTPGRPAPNETDRAIAELVFREGPLTAKQIVAKMPLALKTSEQNVRRVFSDKLVPHYGFYNLQDKAGYRAPKTRTWE
jgi:hypothetical protein